MEHRNCHVAVALNECSMTFPMVTFAVKGELRLPMQLEELVVDVLQFNYALGFRKVDFGETFFLEARVACCNNRTGFISAMDAEFVIGRGIAVVERLLVCQSALGSIPGFASLGNN